MDIKPIKNDDDLKEALDELYRLWDAEPDTPDGDKRAVLGALISEYEDEHHAIPLPDPIAALEYYIESRIGVTKETLVPCIGSIEMVEAILDAKVPLTLSMIHKLHKATGIRIEVLAQPYETEKGYYSPELTEIVSKEMAYGD